MKTSHRASGTAAIVPPNETHTLEPPEQAARSGVCLGAAPVRGNARTGSLSASAATKSGDERSVRFLDELFRDCRPRQVGFRFADGSRWPDEERRPATFVLKHAGSLREMFGAGTEKALAEAFIRGDFEIEGDIESAFELADVLRQKGRHGWPSLLRSFYAFSRLPGKRSAEAPTFLAPRAPRHSHDRDRKAVSFHYDLSNEFYRLWLDQRMMYSCAYFERADADLDEAQEAKLRMLCRKLRLRPGQRLLDIGCGWGGLAIFAAQYFGVQVTGITLSQRQAEYASAQVQANHLDGRVEIRLKDYRELETREAFDAIVSVGMAEHVGARQLVNYFSAAASLLRPGGVFLNHAIGDGVRPSAPVGASFMEAYVFPDSETPPISVMVQAAESAGLEIRDVENLREHYALTLRHWVRRLEHARVEALRHVNEATFRVWRLYLAGSAHGFARGGLAVYQTLLAKPDAEGRTHLPLTRRDWYEAR